jgi:hypothetical protein
MPTLPTTKTKPAMRSSAGPKRQATQAKGASRPKTLIASESGPEEAIGRAR